MRRPHLVVPAVAVALVLPGATACSGSSHHPAGACTARAATAAPAPIEVTFPDVVDRPAASASAAPASAAPRSVSMVVGQRLRVTVAYPSRLHPTVPAAADSTVLCTLDQGSTGTSTWATFQAAATGSTTVSATLNPGARFNRPDLSVAVVVGHG